MKVYTKDMLCYVPRWLRRSKKWCYAIRLRRCRKFPIDAR